MATKANQEKRLLEWQRKMDPSNFNKARGAHFHTAPIVLRPSDAEYPSDLPDDSITLLFRISDEGWLAGEPSRLVVNDPIVIEKEPRKGAKNGPVFILGADSAICSIACNDNYYWAANVLSKHRVLRVKFVPERKHDDGKRRSIAVFATFIPSDDK